MKFNEKLVFLRNQHGYSQEALAEKLGVSRWKTGDTTPEMSLLIKICAAFNVSTDYLIHDGNTGEIALAAVFAVLG